jgi:hypothetical protein
MIRRLAEWLIADGFNSTRWWRFYTGLTVFAAFVNGLVVWGKWGAGKWLWAVVQLIPLILPIAAWLYARRLRRIVDRQEQELKMENPVSDVVVRVEERADGHWVITDGPLSIVPAEAREFGPAPSLQAAHEHALSVAQLLGALYETPVLSGNPNRS